jgi:hypothetical protein
MVSDAELQDMERWAKDDLRGNLGQQAAARRTLQLLEEVRLARRLVRGLYHRMADAGGQVDLQAELERYAADIGIIPIAGRRLTLNSRAGHGE